MFVLRILEGGTAGPDITWLLWVALGFFALMVVVGWLVSRNQKPEEPQSPAHDEKENHH